MNEQHDDWFALQSELAGEYSLDRELGRGGMGTVHLAHDVALDRLVAIKVLHPELAARPEQRARFLREARTAAQLAHPNIVPIYAVGETASAVYFVMGFVDGESLRAMIHRHGPLAPAAASRVMREVGQALALAHARGFVHRDITLDNILIERHSGRAILVDFGIAAEIESDGAAQLVGTPAYLAPELIQGDAPSPQSDLYALGVAGWAMLAGRLPFADAETAGVLIQHLSAPVPSLSTAAAATPGRLRRAVERALAKNPHDRPRDAEEWLRDIADAEPPAPLATPLQHWLRRGQSMRLLYGLAMSITAIRGAVLVEYAWDGIWPLFAEFAAVVPLIVAVHLWLEIAGLRTLARAGYRIEDIRLALARQRAERRQEAQILPSLVARTVRDVTVIALVVWLLVGFSPRMWFGSIPHGRYGFAVLRDVWELYRVAARYSYLVFWSGLAFCTMVPDLNQRTGMLARVRQRFWNSRAGELALRVAGIGLDRRRAPDHTLHRPTELVLELAIETCWQALPAAMQRSCAELPAVAESLRERVSQTREMMQQLAEPDLARVPEAAALRVRMQAQHDSAITALERLRLELMQLSGAVAPTGALTEQLRGARALEDELLRDLGAHPSVKRLLGSRRRGGSPGVTPQTA